MTAAPSPRQQYLDWVQAQIEDYKSQLTRTELLSLADEAVGALFDTDDEQYPLTEILLREAVDSLIFTRLDLPSYRRWLKTCHNDTLPRPPEGTVPDSGDRRQAS